MIGHLRVFTGPMFAGKTERLIKEILWETYFTSDASDVGIFKPKFDTRHGDETILSHGGASVKARPIEKRPEDLDGRHRMVFFDEIQFFEAPHFDGDITEIIQELRLVGVDVTVAGLDMDYTGRAFGITARLMAQSTEIHRHTAVCEVCGAPAPMTSRRDAGTSSRFELGSGDVYAPVCRNHWTPGRVGMDLA